MSDHVYKTIEVTGSSATGSDDAIKKAIARAAKSVRNMQWFKVDEIRGHIAGSKVGHWQVTLRIGFTLE